MTASRPAVAESHCCDHTAATWPGHGQTPQPATPSDALIGARDVAVERGGRVILERIDIDIRPREIVTLIGPNGAGKTTLVRVLLGLVPPDRGTLYRRDGLVIGYAPQRFDIDAAVPLTVERFLLLARPSSGADMSRALAAVGASGVSGRQIASLSGGEFQRVALARALLRKPDLLVLDEPVRGVDYTGEAELYDLIGRLRDELGIGVLLVSHDLHVVMAKSDHVLCINRHVCCSGIPHAVAQHPEYVRLFGSQAAASFAVYTHHHDHAHDLAGRPIAAPAQGEPTPAPLPGAETKR